MSSVAVVSFWGCVFLPKPPKSSIAGSAFAFGGCGVVTGRSDCGGVDVADLAMLAWVVAISCGIVQVLDAALDAALDATLDAALLLIARACLAIR